MIKFISNFNSQSVEERNEVLIDAIEHGIVCVHLAEKGPSGGFPEYSFQGEKEQLKQWLLKWDFLVEDEYEEMVIDGPKDGKLKSAYDSIVSSGQKFIEAAQEMIDNDGVETREFDEDEQDAIEEHCQQLDDSFEGDISWASWVYLPKSKEIFRYVSGDTGFNWTKFELDEIDGF